MEKFTSIEILSYALTWLFTSLMRLAAEVMPPKGKATGNPLQLSFWRVLYHFASTAMIAFLASNWLHESDWSYSMRIFGLFLATFLAPAAIDALMLVSGKMLLAEFAKWLATKTGTTPNPAEFSLPESSSPENLPTDDHPENS